MTGKSSHIWFRVFATKKLRGEIEMKKKIEKKINKILCYLVISAMLFAKPMNTYALDTLDTIGEFAEKYIEIEYRDEELVYSNIQVFIEIVRDRLQLSDIEISEYLISYLDLERQGASLEDKLEVLTYTEVSKTEQIYCFEENGEIEHYEIPAQNSNNGISTAAVWESDYR